MGKLLGSFAVVIGTLMFILLFAVISAIPLYFLWNWLMPVIFGLKTITFVQSVGLAYLSRVLFGSTNVKN